VQAAISMIAETAKASARAERMAGSYPADPARSTQAPPVGQIGAVGAGG
jgi:hypothetical protein